MEISWEEWERAEAAKRAAAGRPPLRQGPPDNKEANDLIAAFRRLVRHDPTIRHVAIDISDKPDLIDLVSRSEGHMHVIVARVSGEHLQAVEDLARGLYEPVAVCG